MYEPPCPAGTAVSEDRCLCRVALEISPADSPVFPATACSPYQECDLWRAEKNRIDAHRKRRRIRGMKPPTTMEEAA